MVSRMQSEANRHMVGLSLSDSSLREEGTAYSGAFIAADMENRHKSENTVCLTCYQGLRQQELPFVVLGLMEKCRLCAFQAVKPEAFTKPFCDFLTENPTVFHTVEYTKAKLDAAGYKQVSSSSRVSVARTVILTTLYHSFLPEMPGRTSSSRAASTTPPATAAQLSPSPSARPTSPATAWP